MYRYKTITKALIAFASALILAACGSSSGGGSGGDAPTTPASGTLSLDITDAPIDGVRAVFLAFDAVEIRGEDGWTSIDLGGVKQIDLLSLTGAASEPLLRDQMLPVGRYTELRLILLQDGTTGTDTSTYLETLDGRVYPLSVPSGSSSGLKLKNEFELVADTHTGFVIDFDLAKSLKRNGNGRYRLHPVLRIIDQSYFGHIRGSVDPLDLDHESCARDESVAKVYLYEQGTIPVEMSEEDGESPVIMAVPLVLNEETGFYDYEFGFVELGDYTLALTCDGDRDDPDTVDNSDETETGWATVVFFDSWDVTVSAVHAEEIDVTEEEENQESMMLP